MILESRCSVNSILGMARSEDLTGDVVGARAEVLPIAIDLFAGAGGATQGLRDAGFNVAVAVEIDKLAAESWKLNHPGFMLERDIREVSGDAILSAAGVSRGEVDLLKACPPCQGFSSLRGSTTPDDRRNDLVLETLRIVEEVLPCSVLVENVPGLRRDWRFAAFVEGLLDLGYSVQDYLVDASELGVPQRRRRLVLVATRAGAHVPRTLAELIPAGLRRPALSAGDALRDLGDASRDDDSMHVWREASPLVAKRIAAIPVGGSRFDLPEELQLACHRRIRTRSGEVGRSATGSYGRVRATEPAPTMTTRCTTPACGSFIHPTENRGLSLREAAAFQTFPPNYQWRGDYGSIERQIGNAVPVWMAQVLGEAILRLLGREMTQG